MTTLPERLKELASRMNQDGDKYDAFTLLAEAVQALQAAPEGGEWVSVKDRLPERWEHVEVYPDPNDKRTYNYFAVADGGTNGVKANRWYHNDSDGYDNEITVTHWRKKAAAPSPSAALQAGEV